MNRGGSLHLQLLREVLLLSVCVEREPLARSHLCNSCFVWPPVGSFAAHYSQNTKAVRAGFWNEPWCVSGSLGARGHIRPRSLMKFKTKNQKSWQR